MANVPELAGAIRLANVNTADTFVQLVPGAIYDIRSVDNLWSGPTGLPAISNASGRRLTIQGNGATVIRAPDAPPLRFFYISETGASLPAGNLELQNPTLSGGLAWGGAGTGGGGGGGGVGGRFSVKGRSP